MPEEENKPKHKPANVEQPATENTQEKLDAQGFQKAVNEALQNYMRGLRDIYNKGLKRSEELCQEYLKAQREKQIVADDSLKQDYQNYAGSMQQQWGQENAPMKMADTNRDFLSSVNDRQFELRNNLEDLHKNYLESVQDNLNKAQQESIASYQEFLKAFQNAWVKADVTSLDRGTLASVAQILMAASTCAGQTAPAI